MKKVLDYGFCGADCYACNVYRSNVFGEELKPETIRRWQEDARKYWDVELLIPEDLNCKGCRYTGGDVFHGFDLCPVKKCCREKGLESCVFCSEFAICELISPEGRENLTHAGDVSRHLLVQMFFLTRREFERNLEGLTDDDARKRIEPMNCISWIIAHVANQIHSYFVTWPDGHQADARYQPYGFGKPASQPPLEESLILWRDACRDAGNRLYTLVEDDMKVVPPGSVNGENTGTLLVRCMFHLWDHLGEISSIRQILGHNPPQFVDMHEWIYNVTSGSASSDK